MQRTPSPAETQDPHVAAANVLGSNHFLPDLAKRKAPTKALQRLAKQVWILDWLDSVARKVAQPSEIKPVNQVAMTPPAEAAPLVLASPIPGFETEKAPMPPPSPGVTPTQKKTVAGRISMIAGNPALNLDPDLATSFPTTGSTHLGRGDLPGITNSVLCNGMPRPWETFVGQRPAISARSGGPQSSLPSPQGTPRVCPQSGRRPGLGAS